MNLSQFMVAKREEPISHVLGLINGRITISVERLYYHMICVERLPSPLWDQEPDRDLGLGLGLAK